MALARALVMSPRVLLLDEPLGALDLKLRKEMQIELKRIQEQVGITFVYVTHDQDEALAMSDRVAVMPTAGSSSSARRARSTTGRLTAFVADFIGDTNFFEGVVVESSDGSFGADVGHGLVVRGRGARRQASTVRVGIRPERLVAIRAPRDGPANVAAGAVADEDLPRRPAPARRRAGQTGSRSWFASSA